MTIRLKPCPFCGKRPEIDTRKPFESVYPRCLISCQNTHCPAMLEVESETEEEAIAKWNTRYTAKGK
jgi:Lar family restriction alleviation protein